MYISTNWIRDFVNLDGIDIENLIYKFTMSTAEVEGIIKYGDNTKGVIVGKVVSIENVENSKKLHKALIDVGGRNVACVCGASNIKEGLTVAFAESGSIVNGINITKTTIDNIESCGMCLSEKELGISDDHSGIMILDDSLKAGTDIKEVLPIDDIIYEVDNKSLTNRPDLWGHYGIAREIAAITGRKLNALPIEDLEAYNSLNKLNVAVQDGNDCFRYSAMTVSNIKASVSPYTMRIRLYYCGLRAINLLADLTNYVMLEVGQPMHAFDNRLVNNVSVKRLDNDSIFTTLDGTDRQMEKGNLMIFSNDAPVAIAGVMGGKASEISDDTDSLFLESATFDGALVRKTANKLALRTDAATRYEKTLDPEITTIAIARFITLLKEIDKNAIVTSCLTDVYLKRYPTISITLTKEYIDKKIGVTIPMERVLSILSSLEFKVVQDNDMLTVIVPTFRATKDISVKADIIEEISRIYGYDNIVPETSKCPVKPVTLDENVALDYSVKSLLAEKYGLNEVHSYVWYDMAKNKELGIEVDDNIRIVNSLDKANGMLRNTLVPSMLYATQKNIKNFSDFGIFEIGRTFDYPVKNENVIENKVLGITMVSSTASTTSLLYELKSMISSIAKLNKNITLEYTDNDAINYSFIHPINTFIVKYDKITLGYISVLNPKIVDKINSKSNVVIAEIDMNKLAGIKNATISYSEISKYQVTNLDLSILVDKSIKYLDIENVIKRAKTNYLTNYSLVDIYENELKLPSKKNVTIRFELGSLEKTLTKEEIDNDRENLIKELALNNMIVTM